MKPNYQPNISPFCPTSSINPSPFLLDLLSLHLPFPSQFSPVVISVSACVCAALYTASSMTIHEWLLTKQNLHLQLLSATKAAGTHDIYHKSLETEVAMTNH